MEFCVNSVNGCNGCFFEDFLHYFYLSADMFNEMQNLKG